MRGAYSGEFVDRLLRENNDLRARVAEVEAERDRHAHWSDSADREIDWWIARVKAVEAMCAEVIGTGYLPDSELFAIKVRTALRGEGDRGSEWDEHDGRSAASLHGEGDR